MHIAQTPLRCRIKGNCPFLELLKTRTPTTATCLAAMDVYFNKRILVYVVLLVNFLLAFLVRFANTYSSSSGSLYSLSGASAMLDLPTPEIGLWLTPLLLVASEAALEYTGLTEAVLDF